MNNYKYRSDDLSKFQPAFLKAQSEFPVINKGNKVNYGNTKYDYAKLEDLLEIVIPILNKHKITIDQGTIIYDGNACVQTLLMHESGQFRSALAYIIPEDHSKQQSYGSAVTYQSRYAVKGLLGLIVKGDDDLEDKQSGRITDEQVKIINDLFDKYPETKEPTIKKIGLKDMKWLYKSKYEEVLETIKGYRKNTS